MSVEFHSHNTQVSVNKIHHACFKHSQEGIRPHTPFFSLLSSLSTVSLKSIHTRHTNPLKPVPHHTVSLQAIHPHASWLAPSFFPGFRYRVSLRT